LQVREETAGKGGKKEEGGKRRQKRPESLYFLETTIKPEEARETRNDHQGKTRSFNSF